MPTNCPWCQAFAQAAETVFERAVAAATAGSSTAPPPTCPDCQTAFQNAAQAIFDAITKGPMDFAYAPADPDDWAGTPPATLADAVDRLAHFLSKSQGQKIPERIGA